MTCVSAREDPVMPAWPPIVLGVIGGGSVIAGAVYLAFRPYLAVKPPTAWMPEPTGRNIGENDTGSGGPQG